MLLQRSGGYLSNIEKFPLEPQTQMRYIKQKQNQL